MATIEQLIKQEKFDDDKHKSIITILYIANLINTHYDRVLEKHGITCQQYNVLRILRGQKGNPATVGMVKERMLDMSSDVSRIVERLRKSGLLERKQNDNDRRAVDIYLTIKGHNLLHKIDESWELMEIPTTKLTKQEAVVLNQLLQKFLDAMT